MKTTAWALMCALALSAVAEAKKPVQLTGVANLNTATKSQLELLPGIGPKAAEKIVAHRQKTPFASVDELAKVKGIGKKKLEKLKPYLTVTGQTTLTAVKAKAPSNAPAARSAPPKR